MKIEFRAVIHFLYLRNESNKDIHQKINETYGENSIGLSTVKKWTKLFRQGKADLVDEIRPGRPRKKDLIVKISDLIMKNPSSSCKRIGIQMNCSQNTVKKILTEDLDLRKVNFRWIPYKLNENQRKKRVQFSKELLQTLKSTKKKCNIFTGDETWLYFHNPMPSIWQRSGLERPSQPKKTIASKKVMICVIWSISGIFCLDYQMNFRHSLF